MNRSHPRWMSKTIAHFYTHEATRMHKKEWRGGQITVHILLWTHVFVSGFISHYWCWFLSSACWLAAPVSHFLFWFSFSGESLCLNQSKMGPNGSSETGAENSRNLCLAVAWTRPRVALWLSGTLQCILGQDCGSFSLIAARRGEQSMFSEAIRRFSASATPAPFPVVVFPPWSLLFYWM